MRRRGLRRLANAVVLASVVATITSPVWVPPAVDRLLRAFDPY